VTGAEQINSFARYSYGTTAFHIKIYFMRIFQKRSLWVIATIVLAIGYVISCTKANQVLDLPQANGVNTGTDLLSVKLTTPLTIDGTIDPVWTNAPKLNITPVVPDPGNALFAGYIGDKYPASLRSMYDDQYIYFLAEWNDATNSSNPSPWYFDPATKRWNQEPSSRTYDGSGNLTREGWGEDKIAFLWNVDFSTPKFITQSCYASCHVFTPYMDYSKTPAEYTANTSGNHYTNGANEKIDMWWGRLGYMSKSASLNFLDDNYQDYAGGPAVTNLTGGNANGRKVDDIYPDGTKSTTWPYRPNYTVSPPQGEITNRVSLKLDGTGASVNVPLYIATGAAASNFIMATDTATSGVKRVVAVSSTGVLTFNDGGTLDPNLTTDYNRTGDAIKGGVGIKYIPGSIAAPLLGGRADIISAAVYTGTGWIVEIKRKLKTGDFLKQDVDFTYQKNATTNQFKDQQFGFAIWDKSNYQHGIQTNLVLKFQQ
jgi:hypothetical protein